MERTLKNANMRPLSHSSYLRLQVLCQSFYDVDDKMQVLNDLSVTDLRAFIPELRSQVQKYLSRTHHYQTTIPIIFIEGPCFLSFKTTIPLL